MKRMSTALATLLSLGLVCAIGAKALGDDKPAAKPPADKPAAKGDEKAAMDPMMEAMIKAGTPGDAHKKLDPMAGNWKCAFVDYSGPEPQKSTANCTREWLLDGRYLAIDYSGDFGGMPFKGLGVMGYDNTKKKYNSVWIDNMSTAVYVEYGTYDESTKTFTMSGECEDPMTGKPKKSKTTTKLDGPDKHTMTMYEVGEDGKDKKVFEIVFTRE